MNLKHKESQYSSSSRSPAGMEHRSNPTSQKQQMPLVVTLNCIEDTSFEQDCLGGVVLVEHVPLSRLADARIESASAVLIHSLAFLPRAAQRRLRPWQLILCLGSSDRSVDSALAADLGLTQLVHVDCSRAEEIADTVMALILGLLRRTHLLSTHALSASGWLGSVQPLCRGMRRCRGLVLGIIGRSASARSLATRSLAFKMSVLYFDVQEGNGEGSQTSIRLPPAARRMDTLNDLLAASDVISLHCALTNETVQIINADCLQHIKPGAFLVNTGSCQLLDDCAVKQLLIDGTLAGCALDGAEGPQWMEAWIKEMPNVLILPRSADYSEEVWMEIREKAISMLQAFFLDGVIPKDAISGDEEESEVAYGNEECNTQGSLSVLQGHGGEGYNEDVNLTKESSRKKVTSDSKGTPTQPQGSVLSQNVSERSEVKRSRSGKKAKKRHARQKSQQKVDDHIKFEKESTSQNEDGTTLSGTDQVLSSSPRFSSPEGARSRKTPNEFIQESSSEKPLKSNTNISRKSGELLRDGYIIALHTRHHPALHVSRQRVKGGGWFLDTMSNITKRDPAAQFLVAFRSKDTIGLRSFTAGGKLLQSYLDTYTKYDVDSKLIKQKESLKEPFGDAFMSHNSRLYHVFYPLIHVTMHKINRRMEFVFASHSFDVWESWTFEGSLEECRLVNCRNPSAILDVRIEILAAIGEDGITRWLD